MAPAILSTHPRGGKLATSRGISLAFFDRLGLNPHMAANTESQKVKQAFAKRLAAIRVSLGLTQEEFSRLIGIARDRYAKYELGRSEPPFFILNRIVKFTGHSLDFLIAGNMPGRGKRAAGASPADLADGLADGLRGTFTKDTGWWWRTDEEHRVVDTWRPARNPGDEGLKTANPPRVVGQTRWQRAGADPHDNGHWRGHVDDLEARRTFSDFHYELHDRDGVLYLIHLSGAPIFDGAGDFKGYCGFAVPERVGTVPNAAEDTS